MEIRETRESDFENAVHRYSGSFLQSWHWGEFKSKYGFEAKRLLFENGAAQILFKAALFDKKVAYIPFGPAVDWGLDAEGLNKVFEEIRLFAKERGAVLIRVDPPVFEDSGGKIKNLLMSFGFVKSRVEIQPKDTLRLDLTKSEELLFAEMHQKGRYNIRLAEKKGVKIRRGITEKHIGAFLRLNHETSSREKLSVHGDNYFKDFFGTFLKGRGELFCAEFDGKIISAIAVVHYGKLATYLYGGSSREHKELMPNHLIQWTGIVDAKEKGMEVYDFWGIAPEGAAGHPWEGISRFKRQFGGEAKSYLGAFDLPLDKKYYHLLKRGEELRKMLGRIKR